MASNDVVISKIQKSLAAHNDMLALIAVKVGVPAADVERILDRSRVLESPQPSKIRTARPTEQEVKERARRAILEARAKAEAEARADLGGEPTGETSPSPSLLDIGEMVDDGEDSRAIKEEADLDLEQSWESEHVEDEDGDEEDESESE